MFTLKRPNTNTPILVIITLFIFITACQNTPTKPNTTTEGYWQHYLHLNQYWNFITNGLVANNSLYCTVFEGILQFTDFNNEPSWQRAINLSTDFTYKPVMSKDITAYIAAYDKKCVIFTHHNIPDNDIGSVGFDTRMFGEQYANYEFWIAIDLLSFGAINENNRFIGVIQAFEATYHTYTAYLVYIDLAEENNRLVITDFGFYNIPMLLNGTTVMYSFTWYNDKLFLAFARQFNGDGSYATGNYFLEISNDGSVRNITSYPNISIASLFVYQNYLFAHTTGTGLLKYSTDGEQWTPFGYILPYLLDVKEIDNCLFFYNGEDLYCTGDDLINRAIYQLSTDNIQGRLITSINKLQNYLVITTNHGIFYKLYDDVMRDKVMVASSQEGDIRFLWE